MGVEIVQHSIVVAKTR